MATVTDDERAARRVRVGITAYYFHVDWRTAAQWCYLQWRSAHRGVDDRREEERW